MINLASFTPILHLETLDRATESNRLTSQYLDGLSDTMTGNMLKVDDFAIETDTALGNKTDLDLSNVSSSDLTTRLAIVLRPLFAQLENRLTGMRNDMLTRQDVINIVNDLLT